MHWKLNDWIHDGQISNLWVKFMNNLTHKWEIKTSLLKVANKWVYNSWASCKMAPSNDVRIKSLLQNNSDQVHLKNFGTTTEI